MGPKARRWGTAIRCLTGDHELVTDTVPEKPAAGGADAEPARLRLRCIWCSFVTSGWEQGRPAYRRTQDGKDLALPNPRLAASQDAAAEPVAAAGGDRRNVTKFPVAKVGRLR